MIKKDAFLEGVINDFFEKIINKDVFTKADFLK